MPWENGCRRILKVVGFDDTVIAGITTPSITTIHQPIEEMSELSIAYIDRRRKGRDGAECDDHAGEPCGTWFGVKQKKERDSAEKISCGVFFCSRK